MFRRSSAPFAPLSFSTPLRVFGDHLPPATDRIQQVEKELAEMRAALAARAQAEANASAKPPTVDERSNMGAPPAGSDVSSGFERNQGS